MRPGESTQAADDATSAICLVRTGGQRPGDCRDRPVRGRIQSLATGKATRLPRFRVRRPRERPSPSRCDGAKRNGVAAIDVPGGRSGPAAPGCRASGSARHERPARSRHRHPRAAVRGARSRPARARRRHGVPRPLDRRDRAVGRGGRLQHGDDRLPGDRHRSLLRRPDRHAHLSAHRQRRREPRGRRVPAGVRRGAGDPRPAAPRLELPQHAGSVRLPRRGEPTSTRAGSPASCARRARRTAASSPPRR
jgi:hypothetical protein